MKQGTIIRLPDGREATVVYNGLDGRGIRWGRSPMNEWDKQPPDAMLREPYPSANCECVGTEFEIVSAPTEDRPGPLEISVYPDGSAWCAVRTKGFTNIQECPAGFGDTPQDALSVLLAEERTFRDRGPALKT